MYKAGQMYMEKALKEAMKVKKTGGYPVGAVVVRGDEIISCGRNMVRELSDATAHAEMVAIRKASKVMQSRNLNGCILYTTQEPCPMCAAACVWAKLDGVVFGSRLKDMKKHVKNSGKTWREFDIKAVSIIKKGKPKLFLIKDFMRRECVELFK